MRSFNLWYKVPLFFSFVFGANENFKKSFRNYLAFTNTYVMWRRRLKKWKCVCDQSKRNFVDQLFTNLLRKYVSNYVKYYLVAGMLQGLKIWRGELYGGPKIWLSLPTYFKNVKPSKGLLNFKFTQIWQQKLWSLFQIFSTLALHISCLHR